MITLKNQNRFYVYAHFKPGSEIPFYVGKGTRNRHKVIFRNIYWTRIVKKYGYEIKIIESKLTESLAFQKEVELINFYKNIGGCEANLSTGGEGSSGYKWTESQKQNIKRIQTSNSETIKQGHKKQSEKLKGRTKFNHSGIKIISEKNKGTGNGRAVWNVITPDGIFATIKEASVFYKISTATVHLRIKSKSSRFINWKKESK